MRSCIYFDNCNKIANVEPPAIKFVCNDCRDRDIQDIVWYETYPHITAEKVLKLIKLLTEHDLEISFSYSDIHKKYYVGKDNHNVDGYLSCLETDFLSAFYALLIQLYSDLTTQERNEIKEILGSSK